MIWLHIAYQTTPFSQWAGSTVEHVDNVPANPPATPAPGVAMGAAIGAALSGMGN